EDDVIAARKAPERRLCELVEGVLVEKAMGTREALLAGLILHLLWDYVEQHDLGLPVGADGAWRFRGGLGRIPDVSFICWERVPGDELPDEPIASLVPDLAVEVLSQGNTPKEIKLKLREYFEAGVRLAWVIDPKKQTATIYTTATKAKRVEKD